MNVSSNIHAFPDWDRVPSQNPPKTHSRCVKYSFATRFIKNETYHGSFIHPDYRNKRQKNERLKHGGRAILCLSHRFVTICFVTNNSACWNPAVILLRVRQLVSEELFHVRAITNHCLPASPARHPAAAVPPLTGPGAAGDSSHYACWYVSEPSRGDGTVFIFLINWRWNVTITGASRWTAAALGQMKWVMLRLSGMELILLFLSEWWMCHCWVPVLFQHRPNLAEWVCHIECKISLWNTLKFHLICSN